MVDRPLRSIAGDPRLQRRRRVANELVTIAAIAERYGVARISIRKWLRRQGIPIVDCPGRVHGGRPAHAIRREYLPLVLQGYRPAPTTAPAQVRKSPRCGCGGRLAQTGDKILGLNQTCLSCGKSPDTRPATAADKPAHGNGGTMQTVTITPAERAALAVLMVAD